MKVVFKETKFIVNPEKRTVTCIMMASFRPVSGQSLVALNGYVGGYVYEDFKVVGVSKCHTDDKFDETIGKRIAESRAKRFVYSEGKKRAGALKKAVSLYLDEVNTALNNLNNYTIAEAKHTDSLLSATSSN